MSIISLLEYPLVVLAHEFFDALPVHQYQRTADGWREVLVDVAEEKDDTYGVSGWNGRL